MTGSTLLLGIEECDRLARCVVSNYLRANSASDDHFVPESGCHTMERSIIL